MDRSSEFIFETAAVAILILAANRRDEAVGARPLGGLTNVFKWFRTEFLAMGERRSLDECGCKVGRVAAEYLRDSIHETLRRRWVGANGREHSVRDLEVYFNTTLLERRLTAANVDVLDGEVENLYRLLSGDTSRGMETQVRRQFERNGIDVEAIRDDFVSHQTIYRHLTDCLETDKDTALSRSERVERERTRIGRLQSKSEAVSDEALSRLCRSDAITLGSFEVIANFQVICDDCGVHREITDILQQGGCNCQSQVKR